MLATASDDGLLINGENVGSQDSVMVAGGTRLFPWIGKVISPVAAPTSAPGMPTTGTGTGPAELLGLLGAALALLLAGGLLRRHAARRAG